MNKKAQGISINTIIIAAIALAVLVVLFAIFTGRLGLFSKGVEQTTTCKQACSATGYSPDNSGPIPEGSGECSGLKLPGAYELQSGNKLQCCCRQ